MSKNPLASKIAVPYARALYDYSVEQNIMHTITADFQNLEGIFNVELKSATENIITFRIESLDPLGPESKSVSPYLGRFFRVLEKRKRLDLVPEIRRNYLELVYKTASVKMVEVSTAFPFTTVQKLNLIKKLKELTHAREIRLVVNVDSNLIGGFLIKIDSNVLDFTIKNQLENLAKKLDWTRGIENLEQWI
jgi:F-type H+-transporting ATPase subunit delta